MATSTTSSSLSFPSEEMMSKYLNNHPLLTDDDYLKEKGVIRKTAQVFANTIKTPKEVQNEILLILKPIVSGPAVITSLINIEAAVQDCAAGKVFVSEEHKAK